MYNLGYKSTSGNRRPSKLWASTMFRFRVSTFRLHGLRGTNTWHKRGARDICLVLGYNDALAA